MLSKGCVPIPSYVKCVSENQDDREIYEDKFITVALKNMCLGIIYNVVHGGDICRIHGSTSLNIFLTAGTFVMKIENFTHVLLNKSEVMLII